MICDRAEGRRSGEAAIKGGSLEEGWDRLPVAHDSAASLDLPARLHLHRPL